MPQSKSRKIAILGYRSVGEWLPRPPARPPGLSPGRGPAMWPAGGEGERAGGRASRVS